MLSAAVIISWEQVWETSLKDSENLGLLLRRGMEGAPGREQWIVSAPSTVLIVLHASPHLHYPNNLMPKVNLMPIITLISQMLKLRLRESLAGGRSASVWWNEGFRLRVHIFSHYALLKVFRVQSVWVEKSRSLNQGAWETAVSLKGDWEKKNPQRRMSNCHRKRSQKGELSWQPREWDLDKEGVVGSQYRRGQVW